VATYRRERILPLALRLAAEQTVPPARIIVVDASPDWKTTRDRVSRELATRHPDVDWLYLQAPAASLTVQRNHGIARAETPVVFLFDDDSLMYPDCAEKVLDVYAADTGKILAGVQARGVDRLPPGVEVEDERKRSGHGSDRSRQRPSPRLVRWFYRKILLMDVRELFLPYEERPARPLPASIGGLPVASTGILAGYAMTFRREVLERERFEPSFRGYCPGEDLDLSHRAARHGLLVVARAARLHHFQSAGGRADRQLATALSLMNQAVSLRKHAADIRSARFRYHVLLIRRVLAELLKDGLSRRWGFPQVRGVLRAVSGSRRIFAMTPEEIDATYPEMQADLRRRIGS
jgi:GT2 family glycosyltransferase